MKKSYLLLVLALVAFVLVGCTKTTTNGTEPTQTQPTTQTEPTTQSPTTQSQPTETETTPPIEHQPEFVTSLVEGAITRGFNSSFDLMLDDLSADTVSGTLTGGSFNNDSYLRVLVDSELDSFPNSPDAAIYKMATGSYQIENYEGIGFTIRLVSGTISYDNLVLGLRGDDAYQVYGLSLAECLDPDGEPLGELTSEYQDIVIAPQLSIEDGDAVYKLINGDDSTVTVLSKILGFHLYAENECSAVIEITDVFLINAGVKTSLDSFDRQAVNATDDTCWWRDSTGSILNNYVELSEGASYETVANAEAATYSSLVLNVLGDTSGTSIVPVYSTGEGEAVAWASLKTADEAAVASAVNGAFFPIVIDLEQSGIATENLVGFKVVSTSDLLIGSIFVSNLDTREAVTVYPRIDTENAVYLDNFNRTQNAIDETYEASVANEVVTGAGLNYFIAYHNAQYAAVNATALAFTGGDYDYVQISEETATAIPSEAQYLVFVMKLGEGASLDNLRIKVGSAPIIYANDWYAAFGLKSVPSDLEGYAYVNEDGYAFYIIDLAETGIDAPAAQLDIYYTGAGDLYIDSIFYTSAFVEYEPTLLQEAEVTLPIDTDYHYGFGLENFQGDILSFEAKGDGTVTFDSIRFEYNGSTIYANAGLIIKDSEGNTVNFADPLPSEYTTYFVYLKDSGFDTSTAGTLHLHTSGFGPAGTILMKNVTSYSPKVYEVEIGAGATEPVSVDGYHYLYGGYTSGAAVIKITLSSADGANLNSFRIQFGTKVAVWANANLIIKDAEGNDVDPSEALPTTPTEYYIYVTASGANDGTADHVHLHFGDTGLSGNILVGALYDETTLAPYSLLLDSYVG